MHKWLLLPSGYLSINIPNKIGNIKVTLMKKNNIQIIQSHIIDENQAFLEIAVKTHSLFSPYLVDRFACVQAALTKDWILDYPIGKK